MSGRDDELRNDMIVTLAFGRAENEDSFKLADRVLALPAFAAAEATHTDEDGTVWSRPTAWAYAAACKAVNNRQFSAEKRAAAAEERARVAEAERDEALESARVRALSLNLARQDVEARTRRVAELEERIRLAASGCPFDLDAKTKQPEPDEPCPVCGDLGTFDQENMAKPSRCIGLPQGRASLLTPKEAARG